MSGEPLRILEVYPKGDYFTGAAIQLWGLATGLQSRGHRVIVATRPSELWAAKCREANLPHVALPMRSELDLRSVRGLIRLIREERIQVVHCQKGRARTLALLAGLRARIPVLILNRGVSFRLDSLNRLGYLTSRVTHVVAVSQSIKRGLVAQGIPEAKIDVIHSGTDTERFHPGVDGLGVRRELGLADEDFLVTQVGVRSSKGNEDVLEALARVAARTPRARLLLVGARAPEMVESAARARGLEGRVQVLGYREDVAAILAASDCCVDASHVGLGITGTLREALAVETPVIATALEGNPELVVHGETGLLVPPRDPDALAGAVLRTMEDPAGAKAMARAGRKRVEALFSMRAKVERTEALYRRLLERQEAGPPGRS